VDVKFRYINLLFGFAKCMSDSKDKKEKLTLAVSFLFCRTEDAFKAFIKKYK